MMASQGRVRDILRRVELARGLLWAALAPAHMGVGLRYEIFFVAAAKHRMLSNVNALQVSHEVMRAHPLYPTDC